MILSEKNLIDGEWIEGKGGRLEVINPADGEVIATVPKASSEEADSAVDAADRAFKGWSSLSPFKRGEILRRAREIILQRAEEIARLMTSEQGKPLEEALGEVKKGAEILRYYAEEGERVYGRIIQNADPDIESRVIYQPLGVALAISPWNYPIELLAWKVGGALASGCTVVCKLPSQTPLSPLAFIRCVADAGMPKGALNALTGAGPTLGPWLLKNPKVKKVAFTGSTMVGKQVLADSVDTLKKVSLELGGSLPMIVCADCDIDAAVAGAVRRSFRNMGQICIAVNRIYVDKRVYVEFLDKLVEQTNKLSIGNGLADNCDLGPMCTAAGIETTKKHIEDGIKKGARLLCGGGKPQGVKFEKGFFFEPSILADAGHDMLVMREETFGPLVGVMAFDSIDEAIELANDTPYGLAAIVYTKSLGIAERLSREINAGNIAINNPDAGVINAPYGGWKDSGFGYEHAPEGLYEYLHAKHIRLYKR